MARSTTLGPSKISNVDRLARLISELFHLEFFTFAKQ